MRKIYIRLLPFAILSYFLAYVDRINVSFTALNATRDYYEVVWDPHDIGGRIDPTMLLNFRRAQGTFH
jgi:hypothetical protein